MPPRTGKRLPSFSDQQQECGSAARQPQCADKLGALSSLGAQLLLASAKTLIRLTDQAKLLAHARPPKLAEHRLKRRTILLTEHTVGWQARTLSGKEQHQLRIDAVPKSLCAGVQQPGQLPVLLRCAQIDPHEHVLKRRLLIADQIIHPQQASAHRLNIADALLFPVRDQKAQRAEHDHRHQRHIPVPHTGSLRPF